MRPTLHIIEPTLRTHDGHNASLVECITESCRGEFGEIVVWGARDGTLPAINGARLDRYFPRALRKFVLFHLLTRLLRQPGTILISTATATDLSILRLAQQVVPRPRARTAAFMHYYTSAKKVLPKQVLLRWVARKGRAPRLLTPHSETARRLTAAGFADVHVLPYPRLWGTTPVVSTRPPRLLVPGGVRMDKGFLHVVDYTAFLHAQRSTIPIDVQVTAPSAHKPMAAEACAAIARLRGIGYPHLTLIERTPCGDAYPEMFRGGVILQPYDPAIFASRVSGVTLDAFEAGSPAIVCAGTWSASEIDRTGAGVIIADRTPESIHTATERIFGDIQRYREAACAARDLKRREQESVRLGEVLAGSCNGGAGF